MTRMLTTTPLVFLDIETTGGSPVDSRITEIGAVRVEDGRVVATFDRLVNPEQPVPWFITKLTGIRDEMLWDAPTFTTIADELELFLDGSIFVAHNVNFDYSFIKAEYGRRGLDAGAGNDFDMDRFCTARLSRGLYPAQGRHNLDTVIKAHGIKVKNRHRALDDAAALFEFYQAALRDHGSQVYVEIDRIIVRTAKPA